MAQSFRIPEDVTTLSFDVNMVSEEPMEWIGSRYDDAFQVILIYNETGYERIRYSNSVNTAEWNEQVSVDFSGGDFTTYQTGWETVCVDASAYANLSISVIFVGSDIRDYAYDTMALIDNVYLA